MTPTEINEAWGRQIQADAERGVVECRVCRAKAGLDEAITVWRNGALVFAVCDRCVDDNHLLITRAPRGVEVRAKRRTPISVLTPSAR